MKFRLQSLNDVVTNSSMEVYQEATQYTVDAVKDIINVILKIGGILQLKYLLSLRTVIRNPMQLY